MNTQDRLTAFYEWCRKCNIDVGSNERMLDAYERIADNVKTITVLLLLTCTTALADPPPHANNDNENNNGNHYGNDKGDDDDDDGTPIDDYIGVLAISAIALGGFIKLKN